MDKQKILIIDDEKDFCALTSRNLQNYGNYEVRYALTGQNGIKLVRSFEPDLIFLDIGLREVSGLTIIEEIFTINRDVKIIILSGLGTHDNVQEVLRLGASDFISKPCGVDRLTGLIRKYLDPQRKRSRKPSKSASKAQHFTKELFLEILASLVYATESKSRYLKGHSQRVAKLSKKIGMEMGLDGNEMEILEYSANIHDLGKIGVRDAILDKKGKLTEEEWKNIKKHPGIGSAIISQICLLRLEESIVRHHHERFDGNGYPDGLKGSNIPLAARIIAIADSNDAMVCNRSYRRKMTQEEAVNEIKRNSGTQFDPDVVEIFLKVIREAGFPKKSARQKS
jgi:response regulator RpfG family c-di-GMP phosphodiesterase